MMITLIVAWLNAFTRPSEKYCTWVFVNRSSWTYYSFSRHISPFESSVELAQPPLPFFSVLDVYNGHRLHCYLLHTRHTDFICNPSSKSEPGFNSLDQNRAASLADIRCSDQVRVPSPGIQSFWLMLANHNLWSLTDSCLVWAPWDISGLEDFVKRINLLLSSVCWYNWQCNMSGPYC